MNDDMFVDEDKNETPYHTTNQNAGDSGQNPYGEPQENPYSSGQENPYGNPEEPKYNATGKKIGRGFGIASLVLGIVSLLCFCTCINIVLAILAIIFGIIQIISYESKGMAIGGIVTATISIILFVTCYGLLFSNTTFMKMVEDEMSNGFNQRDIYEFMEEYTYDMEDML